MYNSEKGQVHSWFVHMHCSEVWYKNAQIKKKEKIVFKESCINFWLKSKLIIASQTKCISKYIRSPIDRNWFVLT